MVQETKRFLSYICPHCMQSVIVERDLFSLAAAPAHIKCPCGKSELLVEFKPNRVQLTVPCLFCGREHTVSCSSRAFIRERALAFSCAASGLDCCYVGEEGPVYAATARLEQAMDRLGEDAVLGPFWTRSSWRRFWPSCGTSPPGGASPVPAAAKNGPSTCISARWTCTARTAAASTAFPPPPPTTLTTCAAKLQY